jgi:2-(1,2-epoxy-1,2-dihydrophenyl)acetyl-CoA isomerase
MNIRVEQIDGVVVLTLNRPAVLNNLSLDTIKEILHSIQMISSNGSARALLITGEGRAFCAGGELSADGPGLAGDSLGKRQSVLMDEYFNPLIRALHDLPIPIIAAINGVAAGAGVSFALTADLVIAARSASFLLTFAPRLGIIPDLGATWKLPRLVGWARALGMTVTGEKLAAQTAAEWGLIWKCVDDDELMPVAMKLAAQLAAGPPGIFREVRHALAAAQLNDLPAQLSYEAAKLGTLLDTPAFTEGVAAFQAKREPDFGGALDRRLDTLHKVR